MPRQPRIIDYTVNDLRPSTQNRAQQLRELIKRIAELRAQE